MKSAQEWFDDYAVSHQNKTNQLIHYICVPAILFSVIGLLMSIPTQPIKDLVGIYNPLLENWAIVVGIFIMFFYLRLGFWNFVQMLLIFLIGVIGNYAMSTYVSLPLASLAIFVVAWIGQFYGHKIEGKKPSFIKDVQFLLIGPLWVVKKLGNS